MAEEETGLPPKDTWPWRIYDVIAGAVLPLVCIYWDPFVFRNGKWDSGGMFGDYAPVGYAFIFLGMAAIVFSIFRPKVPGLVLGLLGSAAAFCLFLRGRYFSARTTRCYFW